MCEIKEDYATSRHIREIRADYSTGSHICEAKADYSADRQICEIRQFTLPAVLKIVLENHKK